MTYLSKSKHPAYHLRPNKAIDRLIFLDLIRKLDSYHPLDKHTYVGFGGPFLEDYRLLANEFPKMKLISIERDMETYKRQISHSCSRNLSLRNSNFKDFLATEFPINETVTWLDYVDLDPQCLLEISDLSRQGVEFSMLRITVRAEILFSVPSLREIKKKGDNYKQFMGKVNQFKERISLNNIAYDDELFVAQNFHQNNFPELIMEVLLTVINSSCVAPKEFLPLHAVKYSDGTIMLSLTGVFCNTENRDKVKKHFEKKGVLKRNQPIALDVIDVPALTTKERLELEPLLPSAKSNGKNCLKKLQYLIEGDDSEEDSLYRLQQYETYYRFYPYFGKLIP